MSSTALLLKIGADIGSLKSELDKAQGLMNGFTSQMKNIGGAIAGAFAVQSIASFTLEAAKLAGQMEGVKASFDKLPQSTKLLGDLQVATKGTVNNFELMKAAVKAQNFKIPLETLGNLLQFAQLKAQETGQSVDYMVESLITGIGRQSLPILDNLQISATELRAEVEKVGDFGMAVGNVVARGLQTMNTELETSTTKTAQLTASLDNLTIAWGSAANGTGFIGSVTSGLRDVADLFTMMLGGNVAKTAEDMKRAEKTLLELKRAYDKAIGEGNREDAMKYAKAIAQIASGYGMVKTKAVEFVDQGVKPQITTLASLTQELNLLKATQESIAVSDTRKLATTNAEIKALEEKIKKLRELGTLQSGKGPAAAVVAPPPVTFDPNDADKLFKSPISDKEMEDIMTSINESVSQMETEVAPRVEGLKYVFFDLAESIRASMAMATVGLAEGIADMAMGVGGMEDIGKGLLKAVASFMGSLGQQMIQLGIAKVFLDKLSVAMPGGVLIAAGAALVAASRAISNTINGGVGGGGGARGGSGAGGNITRGIQNPGSIPEGQWRIDGRDLVFIMDKNKGLDSQRIP